MTSDVAGTAEYWDRVWGQGVETRSWYQKVQTPSLAMLDAVGASATDSLVDIGGGATTLVDALLGRGYRDVTELDVSAVAIDAARSRLGDRASGVTWVVSDLLDWRPGRVYRVWHDRAALHFLTGEADRCRYVDTLTEATVAGSVAIVATFAPDGPDHCSGLPVVRYSADDLAQLLGERWRPIVSCGEAHRTPSAGSSDSPGPPSGEPTEPHASPTADVSRPGRRSRTATGGVFRSRVRRRHVAAWSASMRRRVSSVMCSLPATSLKAAASWSSSRPAPGLVTVVV